MSPSAVPTPPTPLLQRPGSAERLSICEVAPARLRGLLHLLHLLLQQVVELGNLVVFVIVVLVVRVVALRLLVDLAVLVLRFEDLEIRRALRGRRCAPSARTPPRASSQLQSPRVL